MTGFWRRLGQLYRSLAIFVTVAVYFGLGPFGYAFFGAMLLWPARDPVARARRLQAVQSFAFRFLLGWMNAVGIQRGQPRPAQRRVELLEIPPRDAVLRKEQHAARREQPREMRSVFGDLVRLEADEYEFVRPALLARLADLDADRLGAAAFRAFEPDAVCG